MGIQEENDRKNDHINLKVEDNKDEKIVNMDELMDMVNKKFQENEENKFNIDNFFALEMDYDMNYTVEQLKHILKYYELSTRKKRKCEMIQDILFFEAEPMNDGIVNRRKYLWECIDEINSDPYLTKFLNITT